MHAPHSRVVVLCAVLGAFVLPPLIGAQEKPVAGTPAPATTVRPVTVKLNLVVGGETRITSRDRWTKFEQFRDIPKNVTVNSLDFSVEKEGSAWSLTGMAQDATQLDQRYRLVLERFGRWRSEFRYDGYPNFISRLTQTPLTQNSAGMYSFPSTIRSALQSATNDQVPGIIQGVVASTPFTDVRTRRQRYALSEEYFFNDRWKAFLSFARNNRGGVKPIGLGAYERSATPTGGFFRILGNELQEPVNYATTDLRVGIGFHGRKGFFQVEYAVSFFENRARVLRWENPFSLTDQEAPAGGGQNRWRFATGQMDRYPDNHAHKVSLSGRWKLPGESFLSGLVAWSFWRQNEAFLPWTLNTAVVTGVPPGVNPTDVASLPRPSLDGQINLFNSDVVLGTRYWSKLTFTGRYRTYRYINETEQLPLVGFVSLDSFWRTNVAGVPFSEVNEPFSYARQQSSIEAVWKPGDKLMWKVEPSWEGWNRRHRQAGRTNEWGVKTQLFYAPAKWLNARTNYRYGSRRPELYLVGPFEFSALTSGPGAGTSGLRMFDQAHRNRHLADIALNFGGQGSWSVSATYRYLGDVFDGNFFGLGSYLQGTVGVDLNYAPSDRYGFVFYYNHDRIRTHYRSIAKGGGTFTWILADEWDRDTRDKVDSLGVGFNLSAREDRFVLSTSYDISLGRETTTTKNPATIRPDMVDDATAFPWPDITSRFHEFRVETSYRFRPNLQGGIRYLFEPYRLADFGLDIMQPYMFGFEAPENDARRYLFLDSRYSSTNAHLLGVYLRYNF